MTELEKLNKIFQNIDDDKKQVVGGLIENAAFMADELQKLRIYITEHGCTETYQNGANQFGKKKSSEADMYNTMIKNYTSVIKQLLEQLPKGSGEEDELMGFIKGKKW